MQQTVNMFEARLDLGGLAGSDTAAAILYGVAPGEASLRTLIFSSMRAPAVSVYPDGDKIGIWAGEDTDNELFFVRDTAVT